MKRIAVAAVASLFLLGACSSQSKEARYSVTPQVKVTVKGAKKRAAQANYRATPEESGLTGSGGSAK